MPGFKIPFQNNCNVSDFGNGPVHTTETARRHRYSLEILEPLGDKDSGLLLFGYKCGRPSIEFDEVAIHNAQDEIFRPGKQHWKPIEFSFYEKLQGTDSQSDQAAELIYKWWASTMIDIQNSRHNEPSSYLKNAQLDMLDGDGKAVWVYEILDSWPVRVTPSDLDYSDTGIADITLTLRYAKAREAKTASSSSSSLSTGSTTSTLRSRG